MHERTLANQLRAIRPGSHRAVVKQKGIVGAVENLRSVNAKIGNCIERRHSGCNEAMVR